MRSKMVASGKTVFGRSLWIARKNSRVLKGREDTFSGSYTMNTKFCRPTGAWVWYDHFQGSREIAYPRLPSFYRSAVSWKLRVQS
jgi:hypothetical protein